jgi:hypothetical protein
MNVVVERGLARCPRCAAAADYCFTECGTEAIRYEIECRMCGGLYCEENSTSPMAFGAGSRTDDLWVPPPVAEEPLPSGATRMAAELRRLSDAAASALVKLVTHLRTVRSSIPPLR